VQLCNKSIVGDFNIHVDNTNDALGAAFTDLLNSFGFKQNVSGPTHHLNHTLDTDTQLLSEPKQTDELEEMRTIFSSTLEIVAPIILKKGQREN